MATEPKTVATRQITKNPRVCGGKACVGHTRIRVMDIVQLDREGFRPEGMCDIFAVHLTLAEIHLALDYAVEHSDEIEADFASCALFETEIDEARAAYLASKPGR